MLAVGKRRGAKTYLANQQIDALEESFDDDEAVN
jgi:hypothetical protein